MGMMDFSSAIFYPPAESLYFIHNIISIKGYEISISTKYLPIWEMWMELWDGRNVSGKLARMEIR